MKTIYETEYVYDETKMNADRAKQMEFCISQFSAVHDGNFTGRFPRLGSDSFHLLDNVHPRHDLAENHVLSVQPISLFRANEKLSSVRVRTRVGHAHRSRRRMFKNEVFVGEFSSVY